MLPVLPMRPAYVEKLWGGDRIRALPAKQRAGHAPPAGAIGEAWEVADLPQGQSVVSAGAHAGKTLGALVREFGAALVGERAQPGADGVLRFPILVKLIDANDDLSVQVHPGADYANAHAGTFSKDEAWLVVQADDGACVLHGTRAGVTRESFRDAIRLDRAHLALREVPARVGDVLRIPPGTLHAVGKGCLLLEVQEPSDTTFRVFDYNRTDQQGKSRQLHIAEALDVAQFGEQPDTHVHDRRVQATHFSLAVHELQPRTDEVLVCDEPMVLYALRASLQLAPVGNDEAPTFIPCGGTCIVPPRLSVRAQVHAEMHSQMPPATGAFVVMKPR